MLKNHYKTLGVHPKATKDQIKKAYRKIAKKNHPDKNPNNPKALKLFREATEAYDIVSDNNERKIYNRKLKAQVEKQLEDLRRKERGPKANHSSTKSTSSTSRESRNYKKTKEAPTGFETSNKSALGFVVSGLAFGGMALILLKRKLKRLRQNL